MAIPFCPIIIGMWWLFEAYRDISHDYELQFNRFKDAAIVLFSKIEARNNEAKKKANKKASCGS